MSWASLWGGEGCAEGEGKAGLCEFTAKQPDKGNGPEGKPELLALAASGPGRFLRPWEGWLAMVGLDWLAKDHCHVLGTQRLLAEWGASPCSPPCGCMGLGSVPARVQPVAKGESGRQSNGEADASPETRGPASGPGRAEAGGARKAFGGSRWRDHQDLADSAQRPRSVNT